MLFLLFISIIIYKIFMSPSYLMILLYLELMGLIWFMYMMLIFKWGNTLDGMDLYLFSMLVLEGVLGLYGLVLLLDQTGTTYMKTGNL